MRFWEFDACTLIKQKPQIKATLDTIRRQINLADQMIDHPVWGERGEWKLFKQVLEVREAEFDLYNNMVDVGMRFLPEVERMVLEMWLQEGFEDSYILEHCKIKNLTELKKIKLIAISKFTKAVMPE